MSQQFENQLIESLQFGFIHAKRFAKTAFSPKLLLNRPETGENVLTELQNEFKSCVSFAISVAFVTQSGIAMLKTQLYDLAQRGIRGRLLISPYLGFNDPLAMTDLLKLTNVDVRLTHESMNMHSKYYLFDHGDKQAIIIGSSNLTGNALKVNYEWNIKLTSTQHGDVISEAGQEFDRVWSIAEPLTPEVIANYVANRPTQLVSQIIESPQVSYTKILPNTMQKAALIALEDLRKKHAKRAIVISATGERVIIVTGCINALRSRVLGTLVNMIHALLRVIRV